jgi:DNA invertase Pin-like site-specific DNA recombinase
VHELDAKGAALTVLEPAFSTKDPTGSILVKVIGMVAEMERRFIRERQQAGIEAAKKRGVYRGRKPTVPADRVREMRAQGHKPSAIAKEFGISRMHVYRLIKANGGGMLKTVVIAFLLVSAAFVASPAGDQSAASLCAGKGTVNESPLAHADSAY